MRKVLDKAGEIERSINTVFRPSVWTKFVKAIKEFKMIDAGDKIAVCISDGKDSMLLAKLMQMLQKISDVPFEIAYISMDPGYNAENRKRIEENSKLLNIPVEFFETDIFDVTANVGGNPCYL
ncbi:MAG: tRNA 2-thiocytidine biosynthesis protein TtcA, partial [Clostridia bacterium]|nr:tRNA 2-thiocytidine biosynthesis protein TtcA [Clostridia bacterium]